MAKLRLFFSVTVAGFGMVQWMEKSDRNWRSRLADFSGDGSPTEQAAHLGTRSQVSRNISIEFALAAHGWVALGTVRCLWGSISDQAFVCHWFFKALLDDPYLKAFGGDTCSETALGSVQ